MTLRTVLIIGLFILPPPLALWLADRPLAPHFDFPPAIPALPSPEHDSGWWLLVLLLAALLVVCGRAVLKRRPTDFGDKPSTSSPGAFPRWAKIGVALIVGGLLLARWLPAGIGAALALAGLILASNGISLRRSGRCLLTGQPGFLLQQTALGGLLWWLIEYLNRFVESWRFTQLQPDAAWGYLFATTLPLMLMAPAVLSLRQWLAGYPGLLGRLRGLGRLPVVHGEGAIVLALLFGIGGLMAGSVWPQQLFALYWLAPLLLAATFGESGLGGSLRNGDLGRILLPALAGIVAGLLLLLAVRLGGPAAELNVALPGCCAQGARWFTLVAGFALYGVVCLVAADLSAAGWRKASGGHRPSSGRRQGKPLSIPIRVEDIKRNHGQK